MRVDLDEKLKADMVAWWGASPFRSRLEAADDTLREIADIVCGWSRFKTDAEKLAVIKATVETWFERHS